MENLLEIVESSIKGQNRSDIIGRYRTNNCLLWLSQTLASNDINARPPQLNYCDGMVVRKNLSLGIALQRASAGEDFTLYLPKTIHWHLYNSVDFENKCISMEGASVFYYNYLEELRALQREIQEKEDKLADLTPEESTDVKKQIEQLKDQQKKLLRFDKFIREQGKMRKNPILDPVQVNIKTCHTYDGIPIVVDGGPGVGKTTTIIQRLKYLIDTEAIKESLDDKLGIFNLNRNQLETLKSLIKDDKDWIFFSPSDELKVYLSGVMNYEGLTNTDTKVKLWSDYRKKILRDDLKIMWSDGEFKNKERVSILQNLDVANDFENYLKEKESKKLSALKDKVLSFVDEKREIVLKESRYRFICKIIPKSIKTFQDLIAEEEKKKELEAEEIEKLKEEKRKELMPQKGKKNLDNKKDDSKDTQLENIKKKKEECEREIQVYKKIIDDAKSEFLKHTSKGNPFRYVQMAHQKLDAVKNSWEDFLRVLQSTLEEYILDSKINTLKKNDNVIQNVLGFAFSCLEPFREQENMEEVRTRCKSKKVELGGDYTEEQWISFFDELKKSFPSKDNNASLLTTILSCYKKLDVISKEYAKISNNEVMTTCPWKKNLREQYLQSIPKLYKDYRRERINAQFYNTVSLKKMLAEDDKYITALEQSFLIGYIFNTISKGLSSGYFDSDSSRWISVFNELCRPVIGVDEASDYSPIDLYAIASFAHPSFSSITLCGDVMQRLTVEGVRVWDEYKTVFPKLEVCSLRKSYRQTKELLDLANKFASDILKEGQPYETALDIEIEPKPLAIVSSNEDDKVAWMEKRIKEIYLAYGKHLPSIAIFVKNEQEVPNLVNTLNERDFFQENGIEIVGGNTSNSQIRVYPISKIKGMEFDAVFFHNIDNACDNVDLIKRYIYVGISRAAFFLGITLNEESDYSNYFDQESTWESEPESAEE